MVAVVAAVLAHEAGQVLVELRGLREDPLAELEAVLPPECLDPLLGGESLPALARKAIGLARVHDVRLGDELQLPRRDVDQPAVVAPSGPRAVQPVGLLLEPRGNLDIAGGTDPSHLAADPD